MVFISNRNKVNFIVVIFVNEVINFTEKRTEK